MGKYCISKSYQGPNCVAEMNHHQFEHFKMDLVSITGKAMPPWTRQSMISKRKWLKQQIIILREFRNVPAYKSRQDLKTKIHDLVDIYFSFDP